METAGLFMKTARVFLVLMLVVGAAFLLLNLLNIIPTEWMTSGMTKTLLALGLLFLATVGIQLMSPSCQSEEDEVRPIL